MSNPSTHPSSTRRPRDDDADRTREDELFSEIDMLRQFIQDVRLGIRDLDEYETMR